MAESSRDTTQLIRLGYASMCEGRCGGKGEIEQEVVQKRRRRKLPPFLFLKKKRLNGL